MTIQLDHAIIPARDKTTSARFLAGLLGLRVDSWGPFAAVRVNDTLTLDFADREHFDSHHLAFRVSDAEFAAILDRVRAAGLAYSADPHHQEVGQLNHRHGGRGLYVYDPDGHNWEMFTRPAA